MADMEAINVYGTGVSPESDRGCDRSTRYTIYVKGRYAGKFAGTIGDFGAYSFNGNKIITTGGGGAVTAKRSHRSGASGISFHTW